MTKVGPPLAFNKMLKADCGGSFEHPLDIVHLAVK